MNYTYISEHQFYTHVALSVGQVKWLYENSKAVLNMYKKSLIYVHFNNEHSADFKKQIFSSESAV